MRTRFLAWSAVLAAVLLAVFLLRPRTPPSAAERSAPAPLVASQSAAPSPDPSRADSNRPGGAPFAERILADYASPSRPPQEDLRDLARTLENFALLVKGSNPLPLGANEEIAAALRGKNKAALRAVADDHRIFNASGQIVDRWETPLYFHAASRDRLEIRSAGPDRQMWTADDLHRLPDGHFLRGEALLAPSLFGEKRTP
jgi:hypothetical protein